MPRQEQGSLMDVRRRLVPTDFSEGSKQAFEYAVGVARTCGAKLTLLHVVELPSYLTDGPPQPT
jgi:nucleotide-binding universal stress UspA family protein